MKRLLFALVVLLLALCAPQSQSGILRGGPLPVVTVTAPGAGALVASIGVNTHFAFDGGIYQDAVKSPLIIAAMAALGVKQYRDILEGNMGPNPFFNALCASGNGFKFNMIVDQATTFSGSPWTIAQALSFAQGQFATAPCITHWEGSNEPDGVGGTWIPAAFTWQQSLWNNFHGNASVGSLPILINSVAGYGVWPTYCATIAGGCPVSIADIGNIHPYSDDDSSYPQNTTSGSPQGLQSSLTNFAQPVVGSSKPVWATEMGWFTAPGGFVPQISFAAQAKYVSMNPFDFFGVGYAMSQIYSMIDESAVGSDSQSFGLLNFDTTPKLAYTTLKNLITILGDGGAYTPVPVSIGFFGAAVAAPNSNGCGFKPGSGVSYCSLGKSDGSVWVALWQEVSVYNVSTHADIVTAPINMAISIVGAFGHAAVYQPMTSASPISGPIAANNIQVSVPDNVILVKFSP